MSINLFMDIYGRSGYEHYCRRLAGWLVGWAKLAGRLAGWLEGTGGHAREMFLHSAHATRLDSDAPRAWEETWWPRLMFLPCAHATRLISDAPRAGCKHHCRWLAGRLADWLAG